MQNGGSPMANGQSIDPQLVGASPARRGSRLQESQTYFYLSLLCLIIALVGFAPSYWLRLPGDEFDFPGLLHLHAAAFTAWPFLLCLQARLVGTGRVRHHRAFGLAGISLATLMLVLGMALAIATLRHRLAEGDGNAARSFLIVSFSQVSMFFGFFVAAIANIERPEWHKRLIIVATLAALGAAIQRFIIIFRTGQPRGIDPPAPPVFSSLYASLTVCGILLAIMVWEWHTRKRVHPAWSIGFVVILSIVLLRIPFSQTEAWLNFAQWFAELGGA